jgi:hypothetical protein
MHRRHLVLLTIVSVMLMILLSNRLSETEEDKKTEEFAPSSKSKSTTSPTTRTTSSTSPNDNKHNKDIHFVSNSLEGELLTQSLGWPHLVSIRMFQNDHYRTHMEDEVWIVQQMMTSCIGVVVQLGFIQ